MISILHMRKLSLRECQWLIQGYTAKKWQYQNLNPDSRARMMLFCPQWPACPGSPRTFTIWHQKSYIKGTPSSPGNLGCLVTLVLPLKYSLSYLSACLFIYLLLYLFICLFIYFLLICKDEERKTTDFIFAVNSCNYNEYSVLYVSFFPLRIS